MDELIQKIYSQAKAIGCCDKFKGTEDLPELIDLFTSPQGTEFCLKHHFPNIVTFRAFKPFNVDKYEIYIDAGEITLINPKRAILIGRTSATVKCDTLERHEVIMMHGARAIINASKWAVVFVKATMGCSYIRNTNENALIL